MSLVIRGVPSRFSLTAHLETSSLCKAVDHNLGNLAFSYSTSLILQFPKHCDHTAPIKNGESIAVYTLANHLGPHYDPAIFSQFLSKAPKEWKMMAVGLGVQGPLDRLSFDIDNALINKDHLDWLRLMMERSPKGGPNVALRGEFTYQILEKYGLADGAIVTGCPSFMLSPLKDLGQQIFNKFTAIDKRPLIHGALGNPWNPLHRSFEHGLLQLVVSTDGVAHVQMLEDHIALARGDNLPEATMQTLRKQLAPHLMVDDLRNFGRRYLRVWWDVPSWMENLLGADFLFGSRIHGVMLALQAGTPAMCAIWDSRTHELCKTMGVPHVSIYDEPWASGNFNWNDIRTEFERQFDPSSFDRLRRERAIQFRDLFINNGVEISPHLHNLATQSNLSLQDKSLSKSNITEDKKLIYLCSTGRAGSSVIMKVLGLNDAILMRDLPPYETRASQFLFANHISSEENGALKPVAFEGFKYSFCQGNDRDSIEWLARQQGSNFKTEYLNLIYSYYSFVASIQNKLDARYIIEKAVGINLSKLILGNCPDSKVIFSMRDPRDTFISMMSHNTKLGYRAWGSDLSDEELFVNIIGFYPKIKELLIENPERIYILKYEDFICYPVNEIKNILKWLDLKEDDLYINDAVSSMKQVDKFSHAHMTSGDNSINSISRWDNIKYQKYYELFKKYDTEIEIMGYEKLNVR